MLNRFITALGLILISTSAMAAVTATPVALSLATNTPFVGAVANFSETVSQDQQFIEQAFNDFMGEPIDLVTEGTNTPLIVTRLVFAQSLSTSVNYRNLLIQDWFLRFLHKSADPGDITFVQGLFTGGKNDKQIIEVFLTAPIYFQGAGNTNTGFVTQVYQDLLGRAPSAAELSITVGQLTALTITPLAFVQSIDSSTEYTTLVIQSTYQKFLRRAATPVEVANWITLLAGATKNEEMQAELVASAEYLANLPVARYSATINWGDGTTSNGTVVGGNTVNGAHNYSTVGNYNVVVTIQDAGGGIVVVNDATAVVLGEVAPVISSAPYATPQPAYPGDLVTFQSAATDANNNALTYAWDFGDGSTGAGANPTHVYATAGSYKATMTVSDGKGGTDTGIVQVVINPTLPLLISKLGVKLNFASPGTSDAITLSGTLLVPDGFAAAGQVVTIDFGGISKSFTLDSSGHASQGSSIFSLSVKASKGTVAAQAAKFSLKMTNGNFASTLASAGLTGTTSQKNKAVVIPVRITCDGSVYQENRASLYSDTVGKLGTAK